ncbi:hypothetical protein N9515_05260 [Vicingaceae bacterium]|nr:hypothetical protein [Vicingaceae bacterium]MDB4061336.1 hypothetical protein [Vicingaceae bacterium]
MSSWDCWWYADSFSQRSIVQSYPIFLLPIGYFIQELNSTMKRLKTPIFILLAAMVGLNIFQVWQFENGIIHSQRMTKEYYWSIIGETDFYHADKTLLEPDRSVNYLPEEKPQKHKLIYRETYSGEGSKVKTINGFSVPEEGSLVLSKTNRESEKLKFAFKDISDTSYSYVITRIRFKSDFEAKENRFGLEFNMIDAKSGKSYRKVYKGVESINWFDKGSWSTLDLIVIPPFMRNENDSIEINAVLKGKYPVQIDNFSVEVIDPSTLPEQEALTFYNDYYTLKMGNWSRSRSMVGKKGYELVDSTHQCSSTLSMPIEDIGDHRSIEIDLNINLKHNYVGASKMVSVSNEYDTYFYESFPLIRTGEKWETKRFIFNLPENLPTEGATLKAYVCNKSKGPVYIRDMRVVVGNE